MSRAGDATEKQQRLKLSPLLKRRVSSSFLTLLNQQ